MPRRQRKSEKATEQQKSDYANLNLMNNAAYGVTKKRVKQARSPHKSSTIPAKTTAAPATASTPPAPTRAKTSTSSGSTPRPPKQQIQYVPVNQDGGLVGDSSLVFILMVVLLALVFWKTIVFPLATVSWDPKSSTDITKLPWKQFLVGVVFVMLVTFIANINDQTYKAMIFFVAALYVVYIVETQGSFVTILANWANSGNTSPQGNKGSGNTQSPPTGGFA